LEIYQNKSDLNEALNDKEVNQAVEGLNMEKKYNYFMKEANKLK
jgi:hypothetical protein